MKSLRLNGNAEDLSQIGDLVFPMEFVEEIDEIVQLAITKILKIYDEDVFALETGVDYSGVMLNTQATNAQRELEIRKALLSIPEVTGIIRLVIQDPGADGNVGIAFQLNTTFGETGPVNV